MDDEKVQKLRDTIERMKRGRGFAGPWPDMERLLDERDQLRDALKRLLGVVDGPWGDGENSESGEAVRQARAALNDSSVKEGGRET